MDGLSSIRLLADFWILIVSVIAFILQFYCWRYLYKSRKSDFSYSGHDTVWFECSTFILIRAILGMEVGVAIFGVCFLYLMVRYLH